MTIAPIEKTVTVNAPPARAFAMFTRDIGAWWPKGKTLGAKPHAAIVIEPRAGGRWFERDDDGAETPWGKVLAWDPPTRLLLGWQLDASFKYDADFLTEVELTFAAESEGKTRVTLVHRDLERFGDSAEKVAASIGEGWPARLRDFADYAEHPA
ncbi:MAG: SRPBCC family protein [Caulobacteraceae bacterium]